MSENSKIEWTHHTFNPWWGCAKVSPGCDHCYAERDAGRFTPDKVLWGVDAERREFGDKHWNEPLKWEKKAAAAGERHRVFCASMADVFDKNAPVGARQRLLSLIADTPNLDWLLLTKRIGNAARMLNDACQHDGRLMDANDQYRPLPNIWLGASIVNQEEADRDIPKLLQVPAAVRFLSMEPLLGPVDLSRWLDLIQYEDNAPWMRRNIGHLYDMLDWVIVGGESGSKARPMHPDWVFDLRDQCAAADVPFLFKQWGEWADLTNEAPGSDLRKSACEGFIHTADREVLGAGNRHAGMVEENWKEKGGAWMGKVGKKAAGRLLDGVTHEGYPKP